MMFSFVYLISQTILFLRFLMIKDAVSLAGPSRLNAVSTQSV